MQNPLPVPLGCQQYHDPESHHRLGAMNVPCPHCHALHFLSEKLSTSLNAHPHFGMCCLQGQIQLPHFAEPGSAGMGVGWTSPTHAVPVCHPSYYFIIFWHLKILGQIGSIEEISKTLSELKWPLQVTTFWEILN